jgi:membrane protease YdiL (CAAX protease family)
MGWKVENFLSAAGGQDISARPAIIPGSTNKRILALQVAFAYTSLLITLWTPRAAQGPWVLLTACSVALFTLTVPYDYDQLGLRWGNARTTTAIIITAAMLAAAVILIGHLAGVVTNFAHWGSWKGPVGYFIWAVVQQFLLQSFFFIRLESIFGAGKPAVGATAILFTVAHIPNPVLTAVTLGAGLATCEAFRRWRAILPLGLSHAMIGLALAVSIPDHLMHHMKVGLGYLH